MKNRTSPLIGSAGMKLVSVHKCLQMHIFDGKKVNLVPSNCLDFLSEVIW